LIYSPGKRERSYGVSSNHDIHCQNRLLAGLGRADISARPKTVSFPVIESRGMGAIERTTFCVVGDDDVQIETGNRQVFEQSWVQQHACWC
jgi:hypothetical protein